MLTWELLENAPTQNAMGFRHDRNYRKTDVTDHFAESSLIVPLFLHFSIHNSIFGIVATKAAV